MANEGGSSAERAISFIVRLVVSLIIPAWGVVMRAPGLKSGEGVVDCHRQRGDSDVRDFLGDSSLATPLIRAGHGNG